jgi:hypothetical protein
LSTLQPDRRIEGHIDEPGAGNLHAHDARYSPQLFRNSFGEIARLRLELLREDHGGIDRQIAVALLARRLDDQTREVGRSSRFPQQAR